MNYRELREELGLSKQQVIAMSQRAGKKLTLYILTRLEEGDNVRIEASTEYWLRYIYGTDNSQTDWSTVEKGAPVFVLPIPKGTFQFKSIEPNGDVCVFGGTKSQAKYRWFKPEQVKVVSLQLLPEMQEDVIRTGLDAKKYMLLHDVPERGEITTRTLAIQLGWDIPLTSRILKALVGDGKLVKIQKGVYSRP